MSIKSSKLQEPLCEVNAFATVCTFQTDQLIEYRPFLPLRRWLISFKTNQYILPISIGTLLMLVLMLDASGPLMHLKNFVKYFLLPIARSFGGSAAAASLNSLASSLGFPMIMFCGFLAILFAAIFFMALLYKTTDLGVSPSGLSILRRTPEGNHSRIKQIRWDELKSVSVRRRADDTSILDCGLIFKTRQGSEQVINLKNIVHADQRVRLREALKSYAADSVIDERVWAALEPRPTDESYTHLWLRELSNSSNRRQLEPLGEGTSLQEGKYTIKSRLGMGGQATVYAATLTKSYSEQIDHPDRVAIKEYVLPCSQRASAREAALKEFQQEAGILSMVSHPKIIRLLDAFVEEQRAYLVLELAAGSTLRKTVKENGAFSEGQVIDAAIQLCEIFSYLHLHHPPITYRDLSPENIMIDAEGNLKLIDFAVARQSDQLLTGTVVGKHAYMAPEQFRGKSTAQSDIYSLGATLYFLLTAQDPEPIAQLHPRLARTQLSAELDLIVARCTSLDSALRYKNVGEIANDLALLAKIDLAEKLQVEQFENG